ncbi:MAG: peptidoglycan editing factor PgeF [Deltaproteobacteria bacterium]|nr:peptidoglycan editing factor PgeF [Deltaproteobacteria bacterium]
MTYSLVNAGSWFYFTLNLDFSSVFGYGFFTRKGPDLHDLQVSNAFVSLFNLKRFVIMHQEHGDRINIVKDGENPMYGDALVITEKRVAGIIKSADCVPIILLDPSKKIAAIIHTGYRGTLKRITEKTIGVMKDLGSDENQINAIIGPSIGKCCYNIGEDVYESFRNEFRDERLFTFRNERIYLDLKLSNVSMLMRQGVTKIYTIDLCTFCNTDTFYSYRRGDKEKRQINFVFIKE